MTDKKRMGLFRVTKDRTTVRSEPGTFFIGSLFKGDHFYVEHRHAKDLQWAWGYGGKQFQSFGWVRLTGRFTPEDKQENLSKRYAQEIETFLKSGRHRRRSIMHYARNPQPPPGSTAATRHVNIIKSTAFFLNHANGLGRSRGRAGLPPTLTPGKKVSWRYLTKDNFHAVVYHPLGYPLRNHGKWGFIRNDSNVKIDPPL